MRESASTNKFQNANVSAKEKGFMGSLITHA